MALLRTLRIGSGTIRIGLVPSIESPLLLHTYLQNGHQSSLRLLSQMVVPSIFQAINIGSRTSPNPVFCRAFHVLSSSLYRPSPKQQLPFKVTPGKDSTSESNIDAQLPMYDMPLAKQVRHLRMFFLVNFIGSLTISLWVQTEDAYTLLAAFGIVLAGFIPLVYVQLTYHNHIRSIRILGNLTKKQIRILTGPQIASRSQIEYPVFSDTPLAIKKFTVTTRDPVLKLFAGDLKPGPSRRYSVQWLYDSPAGGVCSFRVSKKVIQYHPDIRALDKLIRKNAEQTLVKAAKANKNKKK
ncbi:hypothetical protein BX070DRAFT_254835 [Coemansia spiralis]|nr:hypothetical protein BX070DRAFT_254835 [Coemansia spiralis]